MRNAYQMSDLYVLYNPIDAAVMAFVEERSTSDPSAEPQDEVPQKFSVYVEISAMLRASRKLRCSATLPKDWWFASL